MVIFKLDREELPLEEGGCHDLQQAIGHLIPKCDAVAVRSYVTRELAISLIDTLRKGKNVEECGLLAPENGASDTAAWLNYNTLMKMKVDHVRAYEWFINAIVEESAHLEWGLTDTAVEGEQG